MKTVFDLKQEVLKEHSKAQCDKIVVWVGNNQARFDEVFKLFTGNEYRIIQRIAWPMSYCVIDHPSLIKKHFKALVKNLQKPGAHNAIKRNTMRLLQEVDIPKAYQGMIMDICFTYIADPKEAIATKAFSINTLGKLAKLYPDIIPEIKVLLEELPGKQTPAIKSSAARLLKAFQKL